MSGGTEAAGDRSGNELIDGLPQAEAERLLAEGTYVSLERGQPLYEQGGKVGSAYFPVSAVASLLVPLRDGSSVEMATVGREGVVGIALFLGSERGLGRALAQIPGRAFKLGAEEFVTELRRSAPLRRALEGYVQALISLMGQTVACNRVHTIEQRCARWLLMSRDRLDSSEIRLTQEFLAFMLGVRRQSVTEAAGRLQDRGLIRYRRGSITVVDPEGLEDAACECYEVITGEFRRLLPARDASS